MSQWWADGLWLLRHCSLDPGTVRNMRELIPKLRDCRTLDQSELESAIKDFYDRLPVLPEAAPLRG